MKTKIFFTLCVGVFVYWGVVHIIQSGRSGIVTFPRLSADGEVFSFTGKHITDILYPNNDYQKVGRIIVSEGEISILLERDWETAISRFLLLFLLLAAFFIFIFPRKQEG